MRKLLFCVTIFVAAQAVLTAAPASNPAILVHNYISRFQQIASVESARSGIPASIILAQGIHESQSGQSKLATAAHNHFGIKWRQSDGVGNHVTLYDDETYANGKKKLSYFKKYKSDEESYRHHTDFLMKNDRYYDLFRNERTDYKSWAHGLKACGYATDPLYAQKLIRIVEEYNLHAFDIPMILSLDEEDSMPFEANADGDLAIEISPQQFTYAATENTQNVLPNDEEPELFEIHNGQNEYTETKNVKKMTVRSQQKSDKIDENNLLYELSNDYAPLKPTTVKKQR